VTEPAQKSPEPPPPFAGAPKLEVLQGGKPGAPPPQQTSLPSTVTDVLADPDGLADLLVVAMDGAAMAVGAWRYGNKDQIAAKADGKREIKKAAIVYIKAAQINLTPGQALIAAIAAAYGPQVVAAELDGDVRKRPIFKRKSE
jgi:hypothetical protein